MDVEVATISLMVDAPQAAENAADTVMAMTAKRKRPKRRDAVASKKETSRDRSDGPACRASKEEATSVAPLRARGARQTSSRAMTTWTLRTSTTMHSLPSWASVQRGPML